MAGIAELIGGLCLAGALYFTCAYMTAAGNPLRHEYSFSTGLSLLYGFGALLLAAVWMFGIFSGNSSQQTV